MLTLTHTWSRTQKVLLIGATVLAIGAFVAFAYSYDRSHRLPDESILFGKWQMTAPQDAHSSTTLGFYDIVGLHDGKQHSHWHDGLWVRHDTVTQMEGYSQIGWYAGGSYVYMRIVDEPLPQIWQIVEIRPDELHLRHAKRDYVFRRLPD